MKFKIASLSILSATILYGQPNLSGVSISQNAATRVVTIKYTLDVPAIVTLDILTNNVSIGADNFRTMIDTTTDSKEWPLNRVVAAGEHKLVWNPCREWPEHTFEDGAFSIDLRAYSLTQPPDYMVLDLTAEHTATRNMRWFYARVEDLPDGGVKTADPMDADAVKELTNDVYRTTRLVMRKIPAAGNKWRMGSPATESHRSDDETAHYVTFTEDYYLAIYETTVAQESQMSKAPEKSTSPSCFKTYTDLRGSATGTSYCWPTNGHDISSSSIIQNFRNRTGLLSLDLPTEAQWEYACRAGTSGPYYNGASTPDAIAWTINNSKNSRREVGLKAPNCWGMCDMLGNVCEWVLDQYAAYGSDPVENPIGPKDNPGTRIVRGGSVWMGNGAARAAFRRSRSASANADNGYGGGFGYRLCCPAVIPVD